MRKICQIINLFLSFAILAVLTSCVSRKTKSGNFEFVKAAKPNAVIVIADKPVPLAFLDWTTADAAKLLQDYIKQSTGVNLPIVNEGTNPQGNLIIVGETNIGKQAGISVIKLPQEGYLIKGFDRGVAIVGETTSGKDYGTLFGIYKFLEDTLGIRWYFPGEIGTVIPKHKILTVACDTDISAYPEFPFRYGGVGHWSKDMQKLWHPVLRFGARRGMCANHTHETWHQRHGKKHPDYFGVLPDGTRGLTGKRTKSGQVQSFLCYSNPKVLEQHLKDIDVYFATGDTKPWIGGVKPKGNNIPFGLSDTRQFCHCEKCKKLHAPERGRWGKTSDLILTFVKKFGEELKKRHPEAVLWVLAYDHYQLEPKTIKHLPDNVGITLCLIPTVVQNCHPEVRKRNRELIEKWFKLVNNNPERLLIWDYFCYPNCFFMAPTEIPHVLQDHVKFLKGKALGIFNNGFNPKTKPVPKTYITFRIVWLMHQLLWNSDLDLDAARKQWCQNLFGPASPEMDKFYKLLEDRWEKTVWKQEPTAGYVSEYGVYFESYPPKVVTELENLLNLAERKVEKNPEYAKRLRWFRKEGFDHFIAAARKYHTAVGEAPKCYPTKLNSKITNDGNLNEDVWTNTCSLSMVDRIAGDPKPEKTVVQVGYDADNLYIGARFFLSGNSNSTRKKSTEDEQMVFQFGNKDGKTEKSVDAKPIAVAKGRENPKVEKDDMFVIMLQPDKVKGYRELVVNANGSFSSQADVIKARGFFPSHHPVKWNTKNVKVASKVSNGIWDLELTIPWQSLFGVKKVPNRLRAQFLRWFRKDKHHFHCWSPTLSSWDFPLSRFGCLVFGKSKTNSLILKPKKDQAGYLSGIWPDGGKVEVKMKPENKAIISGYRQLKNKKNVESRGIVIFDLPKTLTKDNLAEAMLTMEFVNAVSHAPFPDIIVDHLSAPSDKLNTTLYETKAAKKKIGKIFQSDSAKRRGPRTLDVTAAVTNDLTNGRHCSVFRLRPVVTPELKDEQIHSVVFGGLNDQKPGTHPKLYIEFNKK